MVDEIKIIYLVEKLKKCIDRVNKEKILSIPEVLSAVTTLHMHSLHCAKPDKRCSMVYDKIKKILIEDAGLKIVTNH